MDVEIKLCKYGHEITGDNVLKTGRCKACFTARSKAHREKVGLVLPSTTESVMAGYKEPLKPVPSGFGYYGTLAYDKETQTFTQCHVCGKFFAILTQHTSKYHDLPNREYREQFGLPMKLSLRAPKRESASQTYWSGLDPEERQRRLDIMKSNLERSLETRRERGYKSHKGSLYYKNLKGRCPDQLLDKVEQLAHDLKRTPTRRDFETTYGYGDLASLYFTFGTWNEAIKIAGMTPNVKGAGNLGRRKYSRAQLLEILRDFKEQNGREPMTTDVQRGMLPSNLMFRRAFGTFKKAKEYAGVVVE